MAGASGARPILGVQQDAPTIETIVLLIFYEVIKGAKGKCIFVFSPLPP